MQKVSKVNFVVGGNLEGEIDQEVKLYIDEKVVVDETPVLRSLEVLVYKDKKVIPRVIFTGDWRGGDLDTLFSIIVKSYKQHQLAKRREG